MNTVIIYFITLVILALLKPGLSRRINQLTVIIILSIVLTYFSIFEFSRKPAFISEEANALEIVRGVAGRTVHPDSALATEKIILIDVAHHPQLQSVPEPLDSTAQAIITDRRKLTQLCNWLAIDSVQRQIGAVVCDVLLQQPTIQDDSLRGALEAIAKNNKLFLAQPEKINNGENETAFNLATLQTYSVIVPNYDGMYFNHPLFDSKGQPSLPYALYLHRQQHRSDSSPRLYLSKEVFPTRDKGHWIVNWIIPDLIIEETYITAQPADKQPPSLFESLFQHSLNTLFGKPLIDEHSLNEIALMPIGLGKALETDGREEILSQFHQNKGKPVTVFIGSFSGETDKHQTTTGSMHGALILLNVYLNLVAEHHFLRFSFGLYLFVSFLLVSYFLLIRPINKSQKQPDEETDTLESTKKELPKSLRQIVPFLQYLLEVIIIKRLAYWILLVLLMGAVVLYGQIINIMGLVIFVAAIDFSLKALTLKN